MQKIIFFLIFLLSANACEFLQGKKNLIQGKWQVSDISVPGGEIAVEFLKSFVPGASLLGKTGLLDMAANFLLKESQEKILKSSFHFQPDGKLSCSVASQKIDAATWSYDSSKEQIVIENNGVAIPLKIEELSKEKMVLEFVFKEQKMKLTLTPANF